MSRRCIPIETVFTILIGLLCLQIPASTDEKKTALPYVPDYEIVQPDSPLARGLGEDRNALWIGPFRKHYRLPAHEVGYLNLNPFAAMDARMIPNLKADLGAASALLQGSFYTAYPDGPGGSHGDALPVFRRFREGRAAPLGFMSFNTTFSEVPTISRIIQKGGLATGRAGHHSDGLVDLEEGYVEMVVGELLNSRGILSTRGVAVGHVPELRHLEGGEGRPSGVVLRFMEFPRFQDDQSARNIADRTLEFLHYDHPLLSGDLSKVDTTSANWIIGLIQEAALKDLWVLHGSLSTEKSQNRSAGLVDFGTLSPLIEPNSEAKISWFTSYGTEIQGDHQFRGSRTVRAEAWDIIHKPVPEIYDRLFDSNFAFYQLRRTGLTDQAILENFAEKEIPGIESGKLKFRIADEETQKLSRTIVDIDGYKIRSQMEFRPDYEDPAAHGTYFRVMVNSRKLLKALADPKIYRRPELSDAEIADVIRACINTYTLGDANDVWNNKANSAMRAELTEKVRFMHSYFHQRLAKHFDADPAGSAERRTWYPVEQDLPSREVLRGKIRDWISNPKKFVPEFVQFVIDQSPKGGPEREKWARHYLNHDVTPESAEARNEQVRAVLKSRLLNDCFGDAIRSAFGHH